MSSPWEDVRRESLEMPAVGGRAARPSPLPWMLLTVSIAMTIGVLILGKSRLDDERPRQRHTLLLPTRKPVDAPVRHGLEADLPECHLDLRCGDLSVMIADAADGDFYFMDPPYVEASDTAKFVGYTPSGFTQADHARVASCYRWLSMRGVRALLTNSDTPRTRELYAGFRIVEYGASRSINSKKAGRGMVREIAVLNY